MSSKKDIVNSELDKAQKEILANETKTELAKKKFISEIKNELGYRIKENPNKVIIVKKTKKQKLVLWFKKIFTRF